MRLLWAAGPPSLALPQMTRYVIRAPSREAEARRATCESAGRHFETQGPAPVYRMITLLWLHGHGGAAFEVYDDLGPTGKPGGLAMTGRVRSWARLVNGKPKFDKDASAEVDFAPRDQETIIGAAGRVVDSTKTDSPRPDNGHTARSHPPGRP